ncbi:hypothetical protein XELAEV_18002112mg [Xenopus laevis]|nr:hypothetical protein XELAEV_18002112mg [Xenopus laevis]
MGLWEEKYINPVINQTKGLLTWKRYIDDCLFIWQGSNEELTLFLDTLNLNDFNIKLTSSVSKSNVNFLDLTISVDNNSLITNLYRKPTDTNGFILKNSCHHKKWLNNIPLSQFNRAKRNCSKKEDYDNECQILRKQFREKGYSEKIVEDVKIKCDQKDRGEMLKNPVKRKHNKNDSIPFITTYNCSRNKFEKILQKHWHILKKDKDLSHHLTEKPKILYKKPQTLKQILVPSCIPVEKKATKTFLAQDNKGFYPCKKCKACRTCKIKEQKCFQFQSKVTKETFDIKSLITCNSTNVIYLLQCPCNLQYIGRTGRCLKTRIGEHMNNIKKGVLTHSVSAHFKSHHNSDPSLLTFAGIIHKRTHWRGSNIIKSISQEETVLDP